MTRLWANGVSAWFLFVPIAIALGQAVPSLRVIMQFAGIAILVIALGKLQSSEETQAPWWAIALGAAAFAFPLAQLIPLPFSYLSEIPGRQFAVATLDAAGVQPSAMPVTLSPEATLDSFIAMIPAFALFLATLTLAADGRRKLVGALLVLALGSVAVGLAQISQGPDSPLYFLKDSNFNSAVGLFANRNHFAALLFCCMPFASAWTIWMVRSGAANGLVAAVGCIFVYGILVLGLAVAGSRAGIILAMVAMLSAALLAWECSPSKSSTAASRAVVYAGVIGTIIIVEFGLIGILRIVEQDVIDLTRLEIARTSLTIAADMAPLGSGVGTFVPVYGMYETPQMLGAGIVNYAHNDWLQLWLEGGIGAAVLLGLFASWFFARTVHVWRHGGNGIDDLLRRAASLAVALLLIHSFVDYPLRSTALMCVFALACGLMAGATTRRPAGGNMASPHWRTA